MNYIHVYVFHKGNIVMAEGCQEHLMVAGKQVLLMGTQRNSGMVIVFGRPAVLLSLDVDALILSIMLPHFHISGKLPLQILFRWPFLVAQGYCFASCASTKQAIRVQRDHCGTRSECPPFVSPALPTTYSRLKAQIRLLSTLRSFRTCTICLGKYSK